MVDGHDSASAFLPRERVELGEAGTFVNQANKFEAVCLLAPGRWVSDDHTESLPHHVG